MRVIAPGVPVARPYPLAGPSHGQVSYPRGDKGNTQEQKDPKSRRTVRHPRRGQERSGGWWPAGKSLVQMSAVDWQRHRASQLADRGLSAAVGLDSGFAPWQLEARIQQARIQRAA